MTTTEDMRSKLRCGKNPSQPCPRGASHTVSRYKCRGCRSLEAKKSVVSES